MLSLSLMDLSVFLWHTKLGSSNLEHNELALSRALSLDKGKFPYRAFKWKILVLTNSVLLTLMMDGCKAQFMLLCKCCYNLKYVLSCPL